MRATTATRLRRSLALVVSLGLVTALAVALPVQTHAKPQQVTATAAQVRAESFTDSVRVIPGFTPRSSGRGAVAPGSQFLLSGKVKVRKRTPRKVFLQERSGASSWRTIAKKRSSRSGSVRFTVASGAAAGTRYLRLYAPAANRLPKYVSRTVAVTVDKPTPGTTAGSADGLPKGPTPAPTGDWDAAELAPTGDPQPAGSAGDWTWLMPEHARWNPCSVIRWGYDATGSYSGSLADIKRAFALTAGRTGLHFKYVGTLDYRAFETTHNRPGNVDMVVGWSDATRDPHLSGHVVGVGGPRASSSGGPWKIIAGSLVLDRDEVLRSGFDVAGAVTWGQVMVHEIGHTIGLGHAAADTQLMAPTASSRNHRFGAGDLAGMVRVGASGGCF